MKIRRNQSGISMVEILLAAGMLGAMALGGARLFEIQTQSTKTVEQKYDAVTFINEMRAFLTIEDNCSANFQGQELPYTTTELINKAGTTIFQVGEKYGNQNMEIVSIKLGGTEMGDPEFQSISGDNKNGVVPLIIELKRIGKTFATNTIRQRIKINTRLDADYPGGKITRCNAYSVGGFGFWTPSATGDGIFYNSGNIGMYTDSPKSIVEIGKQIGIHTPVLSVNAQDIQGRTGVSGRVALRIQAGKKSDGFPANAMVIHQADGDELAKFSGGGNIQIGPPIGAHTPLLSVNSEGMSNIRPEVSGLATMRIQASKSSGGTPAAALVIHQASGEELAKFSGGGNVQIGPPSGHTPLLGVNAAGVDNIRDDIDGIVALRVQGAKDSNIVAFQNVDGDMAFKVDGEDKTHILRSALIIGKSGETILEVQNSSEQPKFKIDDIGDAVFEEKLEVKKKSDFRDDVTLHKKLEVKSTSKFVGNVNADGLITANSINVQNLTVSNLTVTGGATGNFSGNFRGNLNGNASTATNADNCTTCSSDRTLKKDITKLDNSLKLLTKLSGYSFLWNNDDDDERKKYGVIAQEVQKVYPDLVFEDQDGKLSVNYIGLIAPILEGVKESDKKIEVLKSELKESKMLIKDLAKRLELLEKSSK